MERQDDEQDHRRRRPGFAIHVVGSGLKPVPKPAHGEHGDQTQRDNAKRHGVIKVGIQAREQINRVRQNMNEPGSQEDTGTEQRTQRKQTVAMPGLPGPQRRQPASPPRSTVSRITRIAIALMASRLMTRNSVHWSSRVGLLPHPARRADTSSARLTWGRGPTWSITSAAVIAPIFAQVTRSSPRV